MRTPDKHRSLALRSGGALSAVAAGLLLLAACGSGGGTSSASSPRPSSAATTVTIGHAGGMSVLATSSGRTLYSSDQENGKVLCTSGACNAIWSPLTVAAHQKPTATGGVAAELTTMKLADGADQVAFEGHPLYTFSLDHGAGEVNGNGESDSFDGTDFTWHAATPSGHVNAAPSSPSSSSSPYGNGGYNY